MIRQPFAEGAPADEFRFDIFGQRLVVGKTLHHVLFELGEFATLLAQQIGNVERTEAVEIIRADIAFGRKFGMFRLDAVDQARPNDIDLCDIARRLLLAANNAMKSCRPRAPRTRQMLTAGLLIRRWALIGHFTAPFLACGQANCFAHSTALSTKNRAMRPVRSRRSSPTRPAPGADRAAAPR